MSAYTPVPFTGYFHRTLLFITNYTKQCQEHCCTFIQLLATLWYNAVGSTDHRLEIANNDEGMIDVNFSAVLENKLKDFGANLVGYSNVRGKLPGNLSGLEYAVTIGVRLSDFIIDEITDRPTYTYFHHTGRSMH
jgi:hypothetical protein